MFHLLLCSADNVKVGPDGSVITIVNVRPVNHGAYRCVASNPSGITHTIVSLIVKGQEMDTFTRSSCYRGTFRISIITHLQNSK